MLLRGGLAKAVLLAGIAGIALSGGQAFAQDATDEGQTPAAGEAEDGEAGEDNVIVVSGIRSSLQSSAEEKRDAPSIIDVITAEDIGKFPTENVADAVQRITGVQITRTRGSGTGASIRGLPTDFTRVQLNGSTLSSSTVDLRGGGGGGNINRSFDFRLLPTEFVSTLEVTKSSTADQQEGGLAGTINVRTVRPLDLADTTFVASGFGVQNSNSGQTTWRGSAMGSARLLDSRLGILVAGGYNTDQPETHNVNNIGWTTQNEAAGRDYNSDGDVTDKFNIPSQVRTEIAREDRSRLTLASIVEFEAADGLKLYGEGFFSKFDVVVESLENLSIFTGATGGVFDSSTTQFLTIPGIAPAQVASTAPFATVLGLTGVDSRANSRINDSVSKTYYVKGGFEFDRDLWQANGSFTYSDSTQTGDNLNLAQIQRFDVTYSCLPGEDICGLDLTPGSEARYLDPNQGVVASLNGAFGREITDTVSEFKAGVSREFDNSVINRISVGGVMSWRDTFGNGRTLVVTAAQLAPLAGLTRTAPGATTFRIVPFAQVVGAGSGSFLGAYSGEQTFPQEWLATDTLALLAQVPRADLAAAGAISENLNTVIDVQEDIMAGYVRLDFGAPDGRISGNVGLRVVRTKSISEGVAPDFSGIRVNLDAGGTVTVPPAGPTGATNSYVEFLPSANVKFDLTDEIVLRLAASRTMSRPNLVQISPSTTITAAAGNFTITSGNPELEPFISQNFDFTAEWYPNPDTSLTFALFQKDLSTLTRNTTDTITLPVTFVSLAAGTTEVRNQLFQRTRPVNQRGVTLKGFEIGYQQVFTFLPGPLANVGVQANYTFISNSDPDVLTAASKHNFNFGAFYEDDHFAVRGSYTWRDKFVSLGLPDGYNGLGVTTQARGNLDLNITVNLTDQASLIFEASNVLDDVDSASTTLGDLPVDYFDTGRQLMFGARFRY